MSFRCPKSLLLFTCVLAGALAGAGAASAPGASSGSVVGATVLSATEINAGGCPPNSVGPTGFGIVTTGSSQVTSANCVVTFGSSNDVARLRMAQSDQQGSAMYRLTTGAADTTFSGDGIATFAPGGAEDVVGSVAVQADGKVVAASFYDDAGTRRAMVMRLTATGGLDGSFAGDGIREFTTVDAHGWSSPQVTIDASGRIVVAWMGATPVGTLRIARVTSTGADDGTFGTGGLASHALSGGGNSGWVNDIAVDDSGRILVAGRVWPMVEWGWFGTTARFNADGSVDNTLGGDGIIITQCAAATGSDMVFDVIPLPGGKFLTSNQQTEGATTVHVTRWLVGGTPDPSFGTAGCANLTGVWGSGLALDSGGRVYAGNGNTAARLTAGGTIDGTFGVGGYANVGAPVRDVAVDVDGSVLASSITSDFRTTRLSDTGSLVTTHGTGGTATITVGGDASATDPNDMLLAPDGQVVQVGRDTSNGTAYDAVIVRTEASKVANYSGSDTWSTGAANGMFGACLRNALSGAITDGTTWTSNAGTACPASNGAIWRGIPETTGDPNALVARTTTATTTGATVHLQFGFRTAAAQPPGTYLAPITFEVVSP